MGIPKDPPCPSPLGGGDIFGDPIGSPSPSGGAMERKSVGVLRDPPPSSPPFWRWEIRRDPQRSLSPPPPFGEGEIVVIPRDPPLDFFNMIPLGSFSPPSSRWGVFRKIDVNTSQEALLLRTRCTKQKRVGTDISARARAESTKRERLRQQ